MKEFYCLPDSVCYEKILPKKIEELWDSLEETYRKLTYQEFLFFKKNSILSLNTESFRDFIDMHPQYKSIEIPEAIECWPDTLMPTACLLNILIHPSLKYLGSIFWNCSQFENNFGGRIYYTGTKEEWKKLLQSYPDRSTLGLDYTPYDSIVEFVDENTFQLPLIDYHTIINDDNQAVEQIRYCSYSGDVTIPTSYVDQRGNEHLISGIGMLSFAFNEELEKVVVPNGISSIGMDAFRGCDNLKEVIIENGNETITIEPGAFYSCKNLEKVYFGRKVVIKQYAFAKESGFKINIETAEGLDYKEYVHETAFALKAE